MKKSAPALDPTELERVMGILRESCGLSLPASLQSTVQTAFIRAAEACALSPPAFLKAVLQGDRGCVTALVERALIGETYFFRHPEHFRALREFILPELKGRPSLQLWSAGCSSGEEAYGLALTLDGAWKKPYQVLATDVSQQALATARQGTYGPYSFRGAQPLHGKWDKETQGNRAVPPGVVPHVNFLQHNLIRDPAPIPGCDVIFCRNVVIYFDPATIAKVLRMLAGALSEGGFLLLGVAELPHAMPLELEWIDCAGATLLRKPMAGSSAERGPGGLFASRAATVHPKPAHGKSAHAKPAHSKPAHAARRAVAPPAKPKPPPAPAKDSVSNPASETSTSRFAQARAAARRGDLKEAETLARTAATEDMVPQAFLLLAMLAESRGELDVAVQAVRRALYLSSDLVIGHAMLVPLLQRLGRNQDASASRRNALRALERHAESDILQGVEDVSAAAIRRALEENSSSR